MLGALKKIWQFAGVERANMNKAIFVGFLHAVFYMLQICAIYVVLAALTEGRHDQQAAWIALLLLGVSILGRTAANYVSQLQQTHAGYFMVANKRVDIGNKLKSVPMGYFNQSSLGNITGVTTTVLEELETTAPMVLVGILGGLINAVVFTLLVLLDYLCHGEKIGSVGAPAAGFSGQAGRDCAGAGAGHERYQIL